MTSFIIISMELDVLINKFEFIYFPKVLIVEIIQYIYIKCADCDKYTTECKDNNFLSYICACGKIRCKFHAYVNSDIYNCIKSSSQTLKFNIRPTFDCIIKNCDNPAQFGYKDIICYCSKHAMNKKVIYYGLTCFSHACDYLIGLPQFMKDMHCN